MRMIRVTILHIEPTYDLFVIVLQFLHRYVMIVLMGVEGKVSICGVNGLGDANARFHPVLGSQIGPILAEMMFRNLN